MILTGTLSQIRVECVVQGYVMPRLVKLFSSEVKLTRIVQIEDDGVLIHGTPDLTSLQISVVNDRGSIQLLVFEGNTVCRLAGIMLGLTKAIPGTFKV